jgi:hypothetical protein
VSVFLAIEQILLFTLVTTRSPNSSNVVFSIDQKFPEHVTNRYRVNEISGGKCLDHVLERRQIVCVGLGRCKT